MSDSAMKPQRGFSFKDHSSSKPTTPLPGDRLDTELGKIFKALQAQTEYFTRTLAPDGTLRGRIVKKENIDPKVLDYWTEQVKDNLTPQIEKAEIAERNTQNWLTQTKDLREQVSQDRSRIERYTTRAMDTENTVRAALSDAQQARSRTEQAFQQTQIRAQDAQTSASSARISEDMAYRWAEKLDGPVFVPNGGDPVDDGFYSAKYWAKFTESTKENGSFWYLGAQSTAPTTGNGGGPLLPGMWYFNTTDGQTFIWNGTLWEPISGSQGSVISVFGRQGAVQAVEGDYAAFYAPLSHTHPDLEDGIAANAAQNVVQDGQISQLDGDLTALAQRVTGAEGDISAIQNDFVAKAGAVMTGNLSFNIESRVQLYNNNAGTVRIGSHRGEPNRPFRFVPAINGAENFGQALSYSAPDLSWYIGNFYSETTRVLTPAVGDEYYPSAKAASAFPFDGGEEGYTRFIENHLQLGLSSWNDLSPAGDPDWRNNQFTVRVGGNPIPSNGWPGQAAGDFLTSHSWGGASGFQMAYAVNSQLPEPRLYMRSKNTNVWTNWVEIGGTECPFPVGSIYMTTSAADPSTLWADTTWEAFAEGRTIVGVGDNGESTWTAGQERGSETHTLTVDEMPAHSHVFNGNVGDTGDDFGGSGKWNRNLPRDTSVVGGDVAHNNIQPSIATYMWKRLT